MKTTRLILLSCLAVSASAALAVDPPPDGGYPNQNTAEGEDALLSLSTGTDNTAIGFHALSGDSIGIANTALGSQALSVLTDGSYNTAIGYLSLSSIATGDQNTAMGAFSLVANTAGGNTAYGAFTLTANTSGEANTAVGAGALNQNTTGHSNTAMGIGALESNTTGYANVAAGVNCMLNNRTGNNNTAYGNQALSLNSGGTNNIAIGSSALVSVNGSDNTAVGFLALQNNKKGSGNIAIGSQAGIQSVKGSNNIFLGNIGVSPDTGVMRLGSTGIQVSTYISGVFGSTVPIGVPVIVDANAHLGTLPSSARYKDAIKPMKEASEAILSLKPVTFHYKKELDPAGMPQFGLVAEEVAKVDPELVVRDKEGKPYTVRYEAVNAMLLNEFLKEHRKVEAQGKEIAELRSALKEQAAQLQKVNELVQARVASPRLVENGR
jgi:trimeric autotransporter adhesin